MIVGKPALRIHSLEKYHPFLLWTLLGAFVVAITSAGAARAADAKPVRIGGTLSLTGEHAKISDYMAKAFRLWVKDVNDRGGLLGRPVELVLLDDRSDQRTAAAHRG